MKKSFLFIRSWLLILTVCIIGQGIYIYHLQTTNQKLEVANAEQLQFVSSMIDTLWSDFYMQNINIPEKIVFAGKDIYLDQVIREELWQRVVRFQSEHWRWPILNYRLDKYSYVLDTLRSLQAPEDLKYVAIQESFLNPKAVSWAKASGFWQFMPPTGKAYNLKINYYIDQRFDPVEATIAAVQHFNDLLTVFSGNWALSAAAYNTGEQRVLRSMRIQGTDNYFDLNLPRETTEYFINILAWKIIIEREDNFIRRFQPQVDFSIPTVEVRLTLQRPLRAKDILPVFNNSYRVWRMLNPIYIRDEVPQGTHLIKIPKENLTLFNQIINKKIAIYMVIDNTKKDLNLGG